VAWCAAVRIKSSAFRPGIACLISESFTDLQILV
jgi:hypothetical protein